MKIKPFTAFTSEALAKLGKKVGWTKIGEDIFFSNPGRGQHHHVWICDDRGAPLWDQWLYFEPRSVITLIENRIGQLGLQSIYRPVFGVGTNNTFPKINYTTVGDQLIEFPRGVVNDGETTEAAAMREAEEEMQLKAVKAELIGYWIPNSSYTTNRIPVCSVLIDHEQPAKAHRDIGEEDIKVKWYDADEVIRMMLAGEIQCGATNTALAWYFAKRLREVKQDLAKVKGGSSDESHDQCPSKLGSAVSHGIAFVAGLVGGAALAEAAEDKEK